jgi:hypothetical protein
MFGMIFVCTAITVVITWLSTGSCKALSNPDAWIGPIAGIIVLCAAVTVLLCPAPLVFWVSLELASLGMGAFLGLVLAMNAGKDSGTGTVATATAVAVSNLGLVADWITKTLLGATLINAKDLTNWLWKVASEAGKTLYPSIPGAPSLIVMFALQYSILGVLLGVLVVRIYLSSFLNALPDQPPVVPRG